MKINVYIQKSDFDTFFSWLNRIRLGALIPCPVNYSNLRDKIEDPLHLSLNPDEYNLIRDTERNLEDIRKTYGNLDIIYNPEPLQEERILIADILRKANRYDLAAEVVETAIQLASQIPGITPLEALIISEKDWLNVEKT